MKNKLIKIAIPLIVLPMFFVGLPYSPAIDSINDVFNSCKLGGSADLISAMRAAFLYDKGSCELANNTMAVCTLLVIIGIILIFVKLSLIVIHKIKSRKEKQ